MSRSKRLLEIRNIIRNQKIASQEELLEILTERGHIFTQGTLSRDLRYLKAIKVPDGPKGMVYTISDNSSTNIDSETPTLKSGLGNTGFLSIEYTGNMAVIKTIPGFAASLAYRIDSLNAFEIIGTIAGDDTLLVIGREGIPRPALVLCLRPVISPA